MPGNHGDRCKHLPRTRTQESGPSQGQDTAAATYISAQSSLVPALWRSAHAVLTLRANKSGQYIHLSSTISSSNEGTTNRFSSNKIIGKCVHVYLVTLIDSSVEIYWQAGSG